METIITSLSIGLLATTSPCVLPLYPGFLAYISGGQDGLQGKSSRYFLGFFVLAGVLTMMLALGGIIALALCFSRQGAFIHHSHCRRDHHHFWDHAAVQC